ncbi:MAG: NAD(P)/FAD-dependent oxidoreductase [Theionarchaea archaeon]|nr:NAD(P)/FAD-dependent oxidoreductase [Theionarchaea archaeon]MBU7039113.1 NAD(P)/FAD-dependent oxidoreductase [Theionarchaea archaeon]
MKIIIVGGGVAGCYLGQLLRKRGLSPLLLEEHTEIGNPVQCAGLIGRETVDSAKVPFPRHVILRRIDGATFYLGGNHFTIERDSAAYVVDRALLDKHFSRGLPINCKEKVISCKPGTPISVTTTKNQYTCDILLGCDGPFSVVRKEVGFSLTPSFYPAAQYVVQLAPEDDFVHLHVHPPFFFWLIPETEETMRVGYAGPQPVSHLNKFLERKEIRGTILGRQAGLIPLGEGEIARKNIALVGDAACQVKPMTGGGIYYGMKASEMAVQSLEDLNDYEKAWKRNFGTEIRTALRIRGIYETISMKNLTRAFNIFKDNTSLIETMADFERHTSILKEFAKNPVIFKLVGSAIRGLLR